MIVSERLLRLLVYLYSNCIVWAFFAVGTDFSSIHINIIQLHVNKLSYDLTPCIGPLAVEA